jgi:hypothetical protein
MLVRLWRRSSERLPIERRLRRKERTQVCTTVAADKTADSSRAALRRFGMTRVGGLGGMVGERQKPHVQLRPMGHPVLPLNAVCTI